MRNLFILGVLLGVLVTSFLGCRTPAAVRVISREQVRVQESFNESLVQYFAVIEAFAQRQVDVTNIMLDDLAQQQVDKFTERANRRLGQLDPSASQERQEILDQLAMTLKEIHSSNEADKIRLLTLVHNLKEKHRALQNAYGAILDAQRKLDEYIQLEKTDEVLVNQLLSVVKVNADTVNNLFDEITQTVGSIRTMIPAGKEANP